MKLKEKVITVFKPLAFIVFFMLPLILANNYVKLYQENLVMRLSFQGNRHLQEQDITKRVDDRPRVERMIKEHGLLLYDWKFTELGYPVPNPENCYVSNEKGSRFLDNTTDFHTGTDVVSKYDLRVIAMHDGKVIRCEEHPKYGLYIDIWNGEFVTRYAHLSKFQVKKGDKVKKGQWIGVIGNTGNAFRNGIHLHFEIFWNGVNTNPFPGTTYGKKLIAM